MSSQSTEHSVLIALRELDTLELQRREALSARERARLANEAAAEAGAEARIQAELAAQARVVAEAEAAAQAEQARRAHELHLRNLAVEAELQRERADRLGRVQAEIDGQLRSHSRRELAGQRIVGVVLLGVLGLAGAIGAMIVTQPRTSVVARAVASADDLKHMTALKEYAAAVQAIEGDLGRMRSDNDRQEAVLAAAAALQAMMRPTSGEPAAPTARPRPRPRPPADTRRPPSTQIKICDSDDPLAEDC